MTLMTLAWLLFSTPEPGARVQLGEQEAGYRAVLPHELSVFPAYANNGFEQEVRQKGRNTHVRVRVHNKLLASHTRAVHVSGLPEALSGLQADLNAAADGYLADQLVVLMTWLRTEIHYDAALEGDQAPAAVLQRGAANCVGLADLALFVLDRMGVRARYVTGIAWRLDDAVRVDLEGNVLHRWIEVFYPDVGWVFCDPAGKVNFVEATYVVLGVEHVHPLPTQLARAMGGRVELLRFKDRMRTVGRFPGADSRLRLRPNRLYTR